VIVKEKTILIYNKSRMGRVCFILKNAFAGKNSPEGLKEYNRRCRLKRAKIVCTIGPACSDEHILRGLVEAGMNVARLNFSHGSYDDHRGIYKKIRRISDKVAIMQDLQGPKIRVGEIEGGEVFLGNSEEVILTGRWRGRKDSRNV